MKFTIEAIDIIQCIMSTKSSRRGRGPRPLKGNGFLSGAGFFAERILSGVGSCEVSRMSVCSSCPFYILCKFVQISVSSVLLNPSSYSCIGC